MTVIVRIVFWLRMCVTKGVSALANSQQVSKSVPAGLLVAMQHTDTCLLLLQVLSNMGRED